MKKVLLVLAAVFCVATVSAKDFASKMTDFGKAVADQTWTAGLRIGSGLQADAEWHYSDKAYVEGRFGMSWLSSAVCADFTALHNWNVLNMDWTPSVGDWFFDAGAGVGVGGREHYCYVGAAGCAKLGIKFNKVPLRLSIDWTPIVGAEVAYFDMPAGLDGGVDEGWGRAATRASTERVHASDFWANGLANFGISCVYCF